MVKFLDGKGGEKRDSYEGVCVVAVDVEMGNELSD